MHAATSSVTPEGSTEQSLRVAMIGLRGIPATYGGVERAVEELSVRLVDRGHEVTVYARTAYSDEGVREYRGVEVVRLPQINTKHAEAASHTALAVAHALALRQFDLIHLHATGPGSLAPLVRLARVPAVVTIQGLDWQRQKWGKGARNALRLAARIAVKRSNRTIVVSRDLQRHFQEEHGLDTVYIPNGVVPEPANGASPSEPGLEPDRFFLFLGRLVPEKHVHTLIKAFKLVESDLSLVIAGPDSHSREYVDELRALAADDPRVRLVGAQYDGDKRWLLSNATAFVQPSSIEGLPIALLEALAVGRYPIVSDIPPNLEPVTIDDELLGESVRVGDVAGLAAAITRAARAVNRQAVGQRLAAHVRRTYDWSAIAAATEEVYRDVLATRSP